MMNDPNIVILAGGISSRMKKNITAASGITEERTAEIRRGSKSMITVGSGAQPFLNFLLKNIQQAGFRTVLILVGEHDSSIRDYYEREGHSKDFAPLTFRFAVQPVPQGFTKPLGTADALLHAVNAVPEWRESSFVVCNSDNLYSSAALRTIMNSPGRNATLSYDRSALRFPEERVAQFAVIQTGLQGFVTNIIEKPTADELMNSRDAKGRIGVSMNAWKFTYEDILPALQKVPLNPRRNEKELPDAVRILIRSIPDSVIAVPYSEHVPDLTNPEDIEIISREIDKQS